MNSTDGISTNDLIASNANFVLRDSSDPSCHFITLFGNEVAHILIKHNHSIIIMKEFIQLECQI